MATEYSRSSEGVFDMSRFEETQEDHAGLFKPCSRVLIFCADKGMRLKGFKQRSAIVLFMF